MKKIIDKLIYERAIWLKSKNVFLFPIKKLIYYILQYKKTIKIASSLKNLNSHEMLSKLGEMLAKKISISGINNIPITGSAIIVCNHPTGIADGIMIYHVLKSKRKDVFFFANADALKVFPQLYDVIAPVEWKVEKRSYNSSRETLKYAKKAFLNNKLAIIFPSGRLSKRIGFKLYERNWMHSSTILAKKYNLPIIPINIKARNSVLFYVCDFIHRSLRDITLFYEVLNKYNFEYKIQVGQQVMPNDLPPYKIESTQFLKQKVLNLNSTTNIYKYPNLYFYWFFSKLFFHKS